MLQRGVVQMSWSVLGVPLSSIIANNSRLVSLSLFRSRPARAGGQRVWAGPLGCPQRGCVLALTTVSCWNSTSGISDSVSSTSDTSDFVSFTSDMSNFVSSTSHISDFVSSTSHVSDFVSSTSDISDSVVERCGSFRL